MEPPRLHRSAHIVFPTPKKEVSEALLDLIVSNKLNDAFEHLQSNPALLATKVNSEETLLEFIFSQMEKAAYDDEWYNWFEFAIKVIELAPDFYIEKEKDKGRIISVYFQVLSFLYLNSSDVIKCPAATRLLHYLILCGLKPSAINVQNEPSYMDEYYKGLRQLSEILSQGLKNLQSNLKLQNLDCISSVLASEIYWDIAIDSLNYPPFSNFSRAFIIERLCTLATEGKF